MNVLVRIGACLSAAAMVLSVQGMPAQAAPTQPPSAPATAVPSPSAPLLLTAPEGAPVAPAAPLEAPLDDSDCPTPSPTPPTPSPTPTPTPSPTPTPTPTPSPTPTPTPAPGACPSDPASDLATGSPSPEADATSTPDQTASPSVTPRDSASTSSTASPSSTVTPGGTVTPGDTTTPTPAQPTPLAQQRAAQTEIQRKWLSVGGDTSFLGAPVTGEICGIGGGGCFREYRGGVIYWSQATGAHVLRGSIRSMWDAQGYERGKLGYPTSDEFCNLRDGGCAQTFTGGTVYWSAGTGAQPVWGAIGAAYEANRWEQGRLGYPTAGENCANGGCYQKFQGGTIYWSPEGGQHAVWGDIAKSYGASGYEGGRLGYPISDEQCGLAGDGCLQKFRGGSIYWSAKGGAHPLWGEVGKAYGANGYENGRLGYPISDEQCGLAGDGCLQKFSGGSIYWSAKGGAHPIWGEIGKTYGNLQFERGRLGFPTGDELCGLRDGGCSQPFSGGTIFYSPKTGAIAAWGEIGKVYQANRFEVGRLGYPTAPELCGLAGGGCVQNFQGGNVYFSAGGGAHAVWGEIGKSYAATAWERGKLGYPVGGELCGLRDGGCSQPFSGGIIFYSPKTGAFPSWGEIVKVYKGNRYEVGRLGYPLGGEQCGLTGGGCLQRFQGGNIYWSYDNGAHGVWGEIRGRYASLAWERGRLGYPTGPEFCGLSAGGCAQRFTGGMLYWSPNSGAQPVWGSMADGYANSNWERGPFGYPIEPEFCGLKDGGCAQRFQSGIMYWSLGSGAFGVRGAMLTEWGNKGFEKGTLGYPTSSETKIINNRITQTFQHGDLVFNTSTGRFDGGPGTGNGAYPDDDAVPCGSGVYCKNGYKYSPRGFAYRNCTDFAAWRLGMVWSQIAGGGDGNARGWRQGWLERGRLVGTTPRVGAVAWWGASKGGGYGHVGIVIGVNSDGSARVEQYNYDVKGGYSVLNMRAEGYLY